MNITKLNESLEFLLEHRLQEKKWKKSKRQHKSNKLNNNKSRQNKPEETTNNKTYSTDKQLPAIINNRQVLVPTLVSDEEFDLAFRDEISANVQTTNVSVNEIMKAETNTEVSEQKILEVISLLNECTQLLVEKQKEISKLKEENQEIIKEYINNVIGTNNKVVKTVEEEKEKAQKEGRKPLKQAVWKIIKDVYNWGVNDILSAKLPQDLIKTIMYSNPLTAIVAENSDILKGIGKGIIKGTEKILNLNAKNECKEINMKLENIEQIVDGMCVFMPSGIEAELWLDDDGNIIVKYNECSDTYTQDEFGHLIDEGIHYFNPLNHAEQSLIMENKIEDLNTLDNIQKTTPCPETRRKAVSLMDMAGLGVDVEEETKKLKKDADKMQEKVEETKNYKRTRLESPKSCKPNSFRTKEVNKKGDKIVVCQDKKSGKWKAQSKMEKKNESLSSTINKLNRLIESINENVEDKLQKIANEVKAEINKIYKDDKDILEYFYVEPKVKKEHYDDSSDMYYIEVRTELGYNALWDLAEKLDKVVQKYDKYAYFDMEGGGVISAVINFDESLNEELQYGVEYRNMHDGIHRLLITDTKQKAEEILGLLNKLENPEPTEDENEQADNAYFTWDIINQLADDCIEVDHRETERGDSNYNGIYIINYNDIKPDIYESLNEDDDKFNYMMLGRLKQDCDYFLGHGNGYEKHLWAGNVKDQIAEMRKIYNKLPEKPDWISLEDIDKYEKDMLAKREVVTEISKKEWDETPEDYKDIINGKTYKMFLGDKGTELRPVKVVECLNEDEKPLALRWKEEMKNYPVIETEQGEIYIQPSEDGKSIEYGTITNAGMIVEGSIEYEPDKSLDWHIQGLADEIFDKYGYPLDESLNEISGGLRNYAMDRRLESDKEKENLKFLKQKQQKQQKENKMSKLGKLTEELNTIINEISDETVENTYDARRKNFDAANGQEDEKFQNYVRARKRFKNADVIEDEEEFDDALEDRKQSGEEWKNSVEELDNAQKKFRNNVDLMLRRKFRQAKQAAQATEKDEAFHDGMLTDVNDLDFPNALADTVETTEEGEVLTLGKVAADVKSLKDEIIAELKTIKADLKDDIQDVKDDIKDTVENTVEDTIDDNFEEIEFLDDMDNEVEEIQDEIEKEAEENDNKEDNKDNEEPEDKPEEELEESYKKYIKTGKLEDLQKTKQAIDKAVQQGEDVEKVKAEIELNAEDEKEEEAAKEYAADKLTEALYATQKTCKIKL